jgi:DNA-binding transcriptional LysR family regulator
LAFLERWRRLKVAKVSIEIEVAFWRLMATAFLTSKVVGLRFESWVCFMSQSKSRPKKRATSAALKLVSVTQALLVGEYLSFRRVATVLGVRQSAVSRRVRELEDELGVSLFERHHAGVRLTNAGVRFLQEAREALLQLDHAVKTATASGSGTIGRLSIGVLSSMARGYLRELIQAYCSQHPDVVVQIFDGASADNIAAVRKRQLDVAFLMNRTDAEGCDTIPLWTERIVVVLPESHALCGKKEIEWTDLRNEHLIVRQAERDPTLCDRLTKRLADRDHNPSVQKHNVGRETLMNLVAMGLGVGLTSEATTATAFPQVVFRPIAGDDELLQFSAAWLPHNDNPALRRFLSLARSIAKERRRRASAVSGRASLGSLVTGGISLYLASVGALARRLGLST